MKEYIDRAELYEAMNSQDCEFSLIDALALIEEFPAADVVEVVRRKNCFYYKPFGECNNTGSTVKPDDYCSYGARMDKEDEQ